MQKKKPERILISRTDSIGDVVLTLPLAGVLRKLFPDAQIFFLGRSYTKPVIDICSHVDGFVDWSFFQALTENEKLSEFRALNVDTIIHVFPKNEIAKLAKKSAIKTRIGTTGRLYHWLYCNKRVPLSRKRSNLHESQLNLKLIRTLGAKEIYTKKEISGLYGLNIIKTKTKIPVYLVDNGKFNLILHPKSRGSAREWGLDYFEQLIELLPQTRFNIYISGTAEEGEMMKSLLERKSDRLINLTGKFRLDEFIHFIACSDGIIAASTGPLHIAAALGKFALGIYPPIRPMHPGRWAPIGKRAGYLVVDRQCNKCRKDLACSCMRKISPSAVYDYLMKEVL